MSVGSFLFFILYIYNQWSGYGYVANNDVQQQQLFRLTEISVVDEPPSIHNNIK